MLSVRDTRRVAWRRRHAPQHYVGYVTVTEDTVRLAGREPATGIDASLRIPFAAIRKIHPGDGARDEVVGEPAVVVDIRDDEPILVRPLCVGSIDLPSFAHKLGSSQVASN